MKTAKHYIDITPVIAGMAAIFIGTFVIAGWIFNIPGLKSLLPYWPTMKLGSACGFILCGATLIIVKKNVWRLWIPKLLSWFIIGLGLFAIANHFLNIKLNLNFFNTMSPLVSENEPMPLIIAFNFLLIGFLFLILNLKKSTLNIPFNILLFIVGFNSLLSLLGYFYPLVEWYTIHSYPEMAIYSAITTLLLTFGILFLYYEKNIIDYLNLRKFTQENFKNILEATPDAIVMINQSGKIIFVNHQTEKLFGYHKNELIDQFVEILIPEPYRNRHPQHRQDFFEAPKPRPMGTGMELFGLRKNQGIFPLEISLSPLNTPDGIVGLAAIRDITDRKRIEEALKEKNIELENAILAKDRFLASMSHELRTPLNAIIGFTGTLLMKLPGPLNEEQEKQLNTVKRSAKHLLLLINDLLDLAKIDSGKVELHLEPVNCENLIQEIYSTLLPLAISKQLELKIDVPQEDLYISTDKRALTQIIINLVNNAIKFTEKGSVIIKITKEEIKNKSTIIIKVIDSGPGIKPEDQEKLFQAFQQVAQPGKRIEGTGLGLHLSQKLAHLIKGSIKMESEVGKGSIFSIELPI